MQLKSTRNNRKDREGSKIEKEVSFRNSRSEIARTLVAEVRIKMQRGPWSGDGG